MANQLFIITGTSQGLGHALAEHCLEQGHWVLSISRKKFPTHPRCLSILQDLVKTKGLEAKLKDALIKLRKEKIDAYHLINNAAVIEPVGSVADMTAKDLVAHIQVNLVAPLELSGSFLRLTENFNKPRSIVQISSGAAERPIQGWSLYCATKAGLKSFTEVLQLDLKAAGVSDVLLLNFSPGVMDTQMQEIIREQSAENFSQVEQFRQMKETGQLVEPAVVAEKLFAMIQRPQDFPNINYDVRDLKNGSL